MSGEKDLNKILKTLKPKLNDGDYVFCTTNDMTGVSLNDMIMSFKEEEGTTYVIKKETADSLNLDYSLVTSWITLTVHSSLEAVGLTAAFSKVLTEENISCNVVAAYYHDHLFVPKKDTERAMTVLNRFSN